MKEIKPGVYEHFKGGLYRVTGPIWDADTNPPRQKVHYQALYDSEDYGDKAWWDRSIEGFFGEVEVNGEKVPRFKYIRG